MIRVCEMHGEFGEYVEVYMGNLPYRRGHQRNGFIIIYGQDYANNNVDLDFVYHEILVDEWDSSKAEEKANKIFNYISPIARKNILVSLAENPDKYGLDENGDPYWQFCPHCYQPMRYEGNVLAYLNMDGKEMRIQGAEEKCPSCGKSARPNALKSAAYVEPLNE